MTNHSIQILSETEFDTSEYNLLITECIGTALASESITFRCAICVLLTDNEKIRALNLGARGLDNPTDVLSFPMLQIDTAEEINIPQTDIDPDTGLVMLGDIVISAERAIEQAKEYNHSLKRELAFLAVHATLHLLGYDHELGSTEEAVFFSRQEEILNKLGISKQ